MNETTTSFCNDTWMGGGVWCHSQTSSDAVKCFNFASKISQFNNLAADFFILSLFL